jgi:hypothetical protein
MNRFGDYRVIRPTFHGMFTLPEPTDVLVKYQGGQREVINGVTRAYITNDGRLTLMRGRNAVGRVGLLSAGKKHRKGKVENTFNAEGQTYSVLLETGSIF